MRNYTEKIFRLFFAIFTCIAYPFLYLSIFLRGARGGNPNKPKIFIVPQLTRVGDIVCSTPVFRAVKEKYPGSYVAVLVSNKAIGIIKNNPYIDELIVYEDYSFFQLIKKIRNASFDWSFSLSATSMSTFFSVWGLIINRVKTTRINPPLTELVTDWMNNYKLLYRNHTYLPAHHLELLSFIDVKNPKEIKEVFTTSGGDKVNKFLKKNNISSTDKLVGVSITAGNKVKEWGDRKFYKLAQQIQEKYKAKIVFIGALSDEKRISGLLSSGLADSFCSATNFSLEELPSFIKKLDLFISVDTGPMHIAHALGVPLVDIIGPVDPVELTPQNKTSIIIKPDSSISPSVFAFKKAGSDEDIESALNSISIEKVFSAVDKLLSI